jgi:hypothetical protein
MNDKHQRIGKEEWKKLAEDAVKRRGDEAASGLSV